MREDYAKQPRTLRPLECEQHAGDMLFVPDLWAHGVLNMDEVIGFATEFNARASVERDDFEGHARDRMRRPKEAKTSSSL